MLTRRVQFVLLGVLLAAAAAAVAVVVVETRGRPAGPAIQVVNAKCPIMGSAIDRAKVPVDLTRTYKGQTVGFCCGDCPAEWDKLTDADKDAKLKAAM